MLTSLGAMSIAIEEAKKGLGFVAPNPPVGCVILDKDGYLLAKGHHRIFGGDHAEVDALKQIKDPAALRGATLYVTLEPCAHQGKTPSCAKYLAQLPLKKVIYGCVDPNPLVSGQGVDILKRAGIPCEEINDLKSELHDLAEVFFWNQKERTPFVTVKVATSLDGQLAHSSGRSKWITGEEARLYAHFLRATHDATLIGAGTFRADNPSLDIRHPQFIGKENKIVIIDPSGKNLENLPTSNLYKCHRPENIFWVVDSAAPSLADDKCRIVRANLKMENRLDFTDLLPALYQLGVASILIEGGAKIISAVLQGNFAQRYCQFIAPIIIGAKSGLSFTSELSKDCLPDRHDLVNMKTVSLGRDILVSGRIDTGARTV